MSEYREGNSATSCHLHVDTLYRSIDNRSSVIAAWIVAIGWVFLFDRGFRRLIFAAQAAILPVLPRIWSFVPSLTLWIPFICIDWPLRQVLAWVCASWTCDCRLESLREFESIWHCMSVSKLPCGPCRSIHWLYVVLNVSLYVSD
jgi:hypothetical protein